MSLDEQSFARIGSESLASTSSHPATPKNLQNLNKNRRHSLHVFEHVQNASRGKMSFFVAILVALVALCWLVPQSVGFPYTDLSISAVYTPYPDLLDASAEDLIAGLVNRSWSSVDLTRVCMER
jgi:hypothetical protein